MNWLSEEQTPGYRTQWKIRRVLHETTTPYQHLQVVELEDFGRSLILDGAVQTTVGDEHIYHDMITHVPLLTHPNPERVLIIGGGDGGTAREVLKHPQVRHVDMVEIDQAVVEASRQYLPEIASAFDHPRLHLHIGDGLAWVANAREAYDVILVDSSDPAGPAEGLFTENFYANVHRALKPGGLFVCQALSPFFHQDLIRDVHQIIARHFAIARPYLAVVPTYPSGLHCFLMGSKTHDPVRDGLRAPTFPTRWYSPAVHKAAFALPPMLAELVQPRVERMARHA